ncbi:MAG TPA: tRNA pseudouridine(13) synthase TruD, partial [Planctomycetes bacterium]|nr:tRNA pseudouridine(13) synthase TruD [Planctomycetota bacterium]
MLIKHKPDDFVVSELIEFEPAQKGPVSVYELRKRKIDTFQALRRIAARSKLPLDRLHAVALKDRQAVTTQLISVEGRLETNLRISGIQLRYLGRAKEVLGADALRGNAFQITVRDLGERDVRRSQTALEGVAAHGLINYFDDQRFGSLSAGQGMVGRDLAKGDYEAAVRKLICTIGKRDPLPEKRFKTLVSKS